MWPSIRPHQRSRHGFAIPAHVTLIAGLCLSTVSIRIYILPFSATPPTMAAPTDDGHGHAPAQETLSNVPLQRCRAITCPSQQWYEKSTLGTVWRHESNRSENRGSGHITIPC